MNSAAPIANSSGTTSLEENTFNSPQEDIISQITEYFQGRIAKDVNDMAGHIINTVNGSKILTDQTEERYEEIEKFRCLLKIQQSVIHITNLINHNKLHSCTQGYVNFYK